MGPIERKLREAGELITDPKHNLRDLTRYAEDAEGNEVHPTHPYACAWCAYGALGAVGCRYGTSILLSGAAGQLGFQSVNKANYEGHGADVFSAAIEAAAELGL